MGSYRKNPRHTSPIRDLPTHVRVTRPHHALAGKVLEVFGQLKHKGKPHLVLVLPDGTRSYIPAAWTDLEPQAPDHGPAAPVAGLADLWRTRQRVDALWHRCRLPVGDTTSTQDQQHASESTGTLVCRTASGPAPLSPAQSTTTGTPDPTSGVSDAQAGPAATQSGVAETSLNPSQTP